MSLGLVGRKVGMMRIFRDDGTSVPVTVIDCAGNISFAVQDHRQHNDRAAAKPNTQMPKRSDVRFG